MSLLWLWREFFFISINIIGFSNMMEHWRCEIHSLKWFALRTTGLLLRRWLVGMLAKATMWLTRSALRVQLIWTLTAAHCDKQRQTTNQEHGNIFRWLQGHFGHQQLYCSKQERVDCPPLPAKINASGVTMSLLESTLFFAVFYSRQQAQKAI